MGNPEIESLKAAFSLATSRNELSTIVVVIGVIVEFGALLFFSKHMSRGEKITLFIGSVLVIFGVAGEYVFGSRASTMASQLQQLSDQKISTLEAQQEADRKLAAQATKDAADLGLNVVDLKQFVKNKASEIDSAKSELKKDIDSLERARDDALQASNGAKKSLIEATTLISEEKALQIKLDKQLSDAKQNIEELQKTLDPRRLTDTQKSNLARSLKGNTSGKITIIAQTSAFDAKSYAEQLATVLNAAGWSTIIQLGRSGLWDSGGSGIWIYYSTPTALDTAKTLHAALKSNGVPVNEKLGFGPISEVPTDQIVLLIGNKE